MPDIVPPFALHRCVQTAENRQRKEATRRGWPEMNEGHGAGDAIRTRDIYLGKVVLYQLSYSRGWLWCQRHLTKK